MAEDQEVTIDKERVVNLVKGFGWDLVAQENKEQAVIMTFEKKYEKPVEVPST